MRRSIVLLCLALAPSPASAAETAEVPAAIIAPVPAGVAQSVEQRLDPERLARMVAGAQVSLGSRPVEPPPPRLRVERGTIPTVPIGLHHLNRFRTPFRELRIETTSEAAIKKDGGSFFVATDGPDALSLFVIDRDNPDNAVALLLAPSELPPTDVTLELPWATLRPASPGHDHATGEVPQPHLTRIKQLFRSLALGQLPPGFRIEPVAAGAESRPRCDLHGLRIEAAQRLESTALLVLIARVSNPDVEAIEIDETGCAEPGVLAVAAWPLDVLEPGDETELYVALRPAGAATVVARPSVLGGPAR